MPEELKASIHAALETLQLLPDIDRSRLEFQALLLEYEIGIAADRESKQSTAKQAAKELDDYRRALTELSRTLENLSPRALEALNTAQEPFQAKHRSKPRHIPGPTSENAPGFFGKPPPLVWGNLFPRNLGDLLLMTERAAHELPTSAQRGRKPNLVARALALTLAEVFYDLTGQRPTMRTDWETSKGYGPFFEFVKVCFKLAGLDAAPERYVRFAAENFDKSMDVIERD